VPVESAIGGAARDSLNARLPIAPCAWKATISTRWLTFQAHAELFLRTDSVEYTDISSERNTLTFLSSANKDVPFSGAESVGCDIT
jgi:hypothetical protein